VQAIHQTGPKYEKAKIESYSELVPYLGAEEINIRGITAIVWTNGFQAKSSLLDANTQTVITGGQ